RLAEDRASAASWYEFVLGGIGFDDRPPRQTARGHDPKGPLVRPRFVEGCSALGQWMVGSSWGSLGTAGCSLWAVVVGAAFWGRWTGCSLWAGFVWGC